MARILALVALLAVTACTDATVTLKRGPLGPAVYRVDLDVTGAPTLRGESVDATLRVRPVGDGARLELGIEDDEPVVAELRRSADGRLALTTVQGVAPGSAGEADLASLVGQLDPPLSGGAVRMHRSWSRVREIATDSLHASLRSNLRIVGFRRVGGVDAAEVEGRVSGRLSTDGPSGTFEGTVTGRTSISWALREGRLAASDTRLEWAIPGVGTVVLTTIVRPG